METRTRETHGLAELKPTNNSRAYFQQMGEDSRVREIDWKCGVAAERLQNFDDKSLTTENLINYTNLSIDAGDLELFELTRVRAFLAEPIMDVDVSRFRPNYLEEIFRNAAVSARIDAKEQWEAGLIMEHRDSKNLAMNYYREYDRLRMRRRDLKATSPDGLVRVKKLSSLENSSERASDLFYPKEGAAYKKELQLVDDILGGDVSINDAHFLSGIDKRWIRVFMYVNPDINIFPEAHEAMNALENNVTRWYGTTIEKLRVYENSSDHIF